MNILRNTDNVNQEPSWIRHIRNRISKRKNFLALICGQTGSGKSWACLSIAEMLDKNFNPSRIVFGLKGLMALINSGENFPAGTTFVWDEFQIDAGNRNWQSLTNKMLNSLLSTFRHKNFILLINSPYSDFIDSQSKKLLHAEWEVTGIDFATEKTNLKPMVIQYNSRRRQFYYKYLRVHTARGVCPVKKWKIQKPTKQLIEEYEQKKTEFTTNLNKQIEAQLVQQEVKIVNKNAQKPLTDKQKQVLDLMTKHNNAPKVAQELNMSEDSVYFHIRQARKKGYDYGKLTEKGDKTEKKGLIRLDTIA